MVRSLLVIFILVLNVGLSLAQTTYYSTGVSTPWSSPTSWTLNSDGTGGPAGPPGVNDYVIILDGHTIEVNNVTDNGGPGQSADGLGLANVGAGGSGTGFPDSNTANFFHNGEMTVEEGGTLIFGTRVMFDGTIFIAGTLTTSFDIIILGNLYFAPTAFFSSSDDLICSGNSNTRVDIPLAANAFTSDDIYLDHTDAFVCGLGVLEIGTGPFNPLNPHQITLVNSATANQICGPPFQIIGCDPPFSCAGTGTFNPSQATITGAGGTINYIENAVLTLDNTIGISYPEPLPYLTAATVTFIGGTYVNGEDVLDLPGISSIVAVFDSGTGTLNLAGYGNVSRWETALRSITYENLSENPTVATRTIEFQVTDGFNLSNTISRNVTIQRVNDPPDVSTISGTPTPLAYAEGVGDIVIDDQIEVADPDDVNLDEARVSLSNYVQGEDILAFSNIFGLTHSFDAPTGVLTISGSTTVENYQAALRTVTYENLSDTPDLTTRTASFIVNDGEFDSAPFDRDIELTATNDTPENTVPGAQNVNEDAVLTFAGTISIADADVGTDDMTITLSVTNGVLDFSTTAGLTGVTDNAASITGTGTLAAINTALNNLTYTPTADYTGGDVLVMNTSDNGNNGSGGAQTDIDNITITVDPINDAPVNTVPGAQNVDEDAVLTFAGTISIADVDAATDDLTITLSVTNGVLDFSTTAGLTGVTDNAATITGTGTIAAINAALNNLTYTPTADYAGGDVLVVNTSDNGNNGSGGVQTDLDNVTITVDATDNDAPVNTVPGAQNVDEDAVLTFAGTISIADADAGTDDMTITLSVTNGVLDFSTTAGLTGVTDNAATITGTGTLAAINTALNNLTYSPTADYAGGDVLVVNTSDNGNNGSGGVQTDIDNITITVDPINDAPINTVPGAQTVDEDAVLTFAGTISIADVDAASDDMTIILSVTNGVLDFSTTAGLTSVTDNAASITGTGTIAAINAALNNLTYTPTSNYSGGDVLVVNTSDNGNNGSGGFQSDMNNITLTVDATNDAPLNTVPGAQIVDEDAVLTFAGTISIADADAGTDDLTITLSVTNGVLDFSTSAGLTGVTDNAATIIATGTIVDINTALNNLTYTPTVDYAGGDVLVVNTSDNGNNGAGGAQSDIDNITITVDPINDAPINTVPGAQTVDEDAVLTFAGTISIADVDAASDDMTITLSVTNGVLDFSTTAGLTGVTDNAATITATGTIGALNTALNNLTYTPTADYSGGDVLVVNTSDNGNNGSGGVQTDLDNITITVDPLNDAPLNTVPGAQTVDEDAVLAFAGTISIADADAGTDDLTITLSVTNGVLDFSTIAGLTGVIDNAATITGTGTIAAINAALNNLTYTPTADYAGGDVLVVNTSDNGSNGSGGVQTDSDNVTITVDPINDAPVNTVPGVQTVDEDAVLTFAGTISIADVDAATDDLTITLSVTNGVLDFSTTAGLTGVTDNAATITGTGTIAVINTALNNLTYTPTADYAGGDVLVVNTSDNGNNGSGGVQTDVDNISINVNSINDLPVAIDQTVTTDEDIDVDIDLSLLVSDPDDGVDLTTISIGTNPVNGSITNINTATGVVTYSPNNHYFGSDSFTFTIDDFSGGSSNLATISITINSINDLPVASDQAVVTDEDTDVDIDIAALVTDVDHTIDFATINIVNSPVNGVITGINPTTGIVTYSPNANYNGADSFTYTVSDGSGGLSNLGTISKTITSINDLPILSGSITTVNYTEGDGAVVLDNTITVDDVDHPNLTSAIIRISSNYQITEDQLSFTAGGGISGSYNAGVLTLTGNATLANYEAVLQSITYENTSDAPNTTTRTISIIINDGEDNSIDLAIDININPANDAPLCSGTATDLIYTEGDGAVVLDNGLTVSDLDNTTIASATVSISANFQAAEDVLAFSNQNGITGSLVGGVLTLAGTASISAYEMALSSITYENTSESPNSTTREVSVVINDGTDNSPAFVRNIQVNPINDLPLVVGNPNPIIYTEGDGVVLIEPTVLVTDIDDINLESATISLVNNYTSPEDVLAFTDQFGITGSFNGGILSLTGTANWALYQAAIRTITYENTSIAPETATRLLSIVVNDGEDNSAVYTREIQITAISEPTVITIGGGSTTLEIDYTEGEGARQLAPALQLADPDDANLEGAIVEIESNFTEGEDLLSFTSQSGVTGSFTPADGILIIQGTATLAEYGTILQSIAYENTSDNPNILARSITIRVDDGDTFSSPVTITVNVIPVNDAPILAGANAPLVYPESSGPIPLDNSITVTDPDHASLQGATIRFTNNFVASEDVLGFVDQSGISGQFNAADGSLTLAGGASLAEYQNALRSITYENTNDLANLDTRDVEFIISDGELNSEPYALEIVLEEVTDPVIVYQVVTPDGDAMNDTWVIDGIEQYPSNTVSVFNRYNSMVYTKNGYENSVNPWSGTANSGLGNGPLPDGTYFYTVDLGDGSKLLEGFLVLKSK